MGRWENEGKSPRFYEVIVEGSHLLTRYGKVGTDGKATVKDLKTPDKAEKEAAKRIGEKERAGYQKVSVDDFDEKLDAQLEAAILAAPDDDAGFLVYADWLQGQGDPRGELIVAQAHDDPKAAAKVLDKQKARFCPPRTTKMSKKARRKDKHASGYTELTWSHGFIRTARLARNSDRPPITVREIVEELLPHPSARFLDALIIGPLGVDEVFQYEDVIRPIARIAPRSLRKLFVGDFADEHTEVGFARFGDVQGLSRLPALEELHLRGGTVTLHGLELSRLKRFTLEVQEASATLLSDLAHVKWPVLSELALTVRNTALDAGPLGPLFDAKLDTLALRGTTKTGELLRALLSAPILASLRVLDLSGGDLTDESAETLLGASDRLRHLRRLDLSRCHLSDEAVSRLAELDVVANDQRPQLGPGLDLNDVRIQRFAEDAKSVTTARKLAKASKWSSLGRADTMLWGTYPGSGGTYEVYADVGSTLESGCTCPSFKYPCKHALGLLLMAVAGHGFPREAPPAGLVDRAEQGRYSSGWE